MRNRIVELKIMAFITTDPAGIKTVTKFAAVSNI
jgi:hypothetical protein